jgi:lysophospholipase L1-like esterase
VSIYIGINDVWRLFGDHAEEAVPVAEYESIYRDLLEETRGKTGAGLILMTPTLLEPNRDDPFRRGIDEHIEAVRRVAEEFQAVLVDVQRAFDAAMCAQPPAFWAEDRVHVSGPGNALIAREWLRAVGPTPW